MVADKGISHTRQIAKIPSPNKMPPPKIKSKKQKKSPHFSSKTRANSNILAPFPTWGSEKNAAECEFN